MLPDSTINDVLGKIDAIETISNQFNKKSKWDKAKEVLKWVTEQGIQVAAIVNPLLGSVVK